MTLPLSRPKIHRLPAASRRPAAVLPPAVIIALLLATLVFGVSVNRAMFGPSSANAVAETPAYMAETHAGLDAPAAEAADTIVIKGENQAIVGQLAKIPMQNQQITGITSVSNVDKGGNRDLLSIIGKY